MRDEQTSHCIYYKIGWLVYKYISLRLTRGANSNEYKEKRKTSLIFIPFFPSLSFKDIPFPAGKGSFKYLPLLVCKILLQVTRSHPA